MALASHLLVYIDRVKKRTEEIVESEFPAGYIQRMGNEPLSQVLEAAADVFDLKENQRIRFRRISFSEFSKLLEHEQESFDAHQRDFAVIFQSSGAEPGSWVDMDQLDGPVESEKHEELELF